MRIAFIGEGLVLSAALEWARNRGHDTVALFATAAAEAAALSRTCPCVTAEGMDPAAFVRRHPADVLISAANRHILDPETLARPRLGCVNYHNGPLPDYAGLRATAWAILNGEAGHGITWHRIEAGIDTGPILSQRLFDLDPGETTASLNARCTAAAIGCLDHVFARLEAGDVSGSPQRTEGRRYFGRADVVPDAGLVDWHWPAERVLRLVRACDWGPAANDFGTAAVVFRDTAAFIRTARLASASAPSGAVLAVAGPSLTVGCGGGAVTIGLDRVLDIHPGQRLDLPDATRRTGLAGWHRRAMRHEARLLPALRRLAAQPAWPGPDTAVPVEADAAGVATALAAVAGRNAVVAVQIPVPMDGLCQRWLPFHFGTGALSAGPPLPGDLHLRRPEFAWAAEWPARAMVAIPGHVGVVRDVLCRGDVSIALDLAEALVQPAYGRAGPAARATVVELLDLQAAIDPGAPAIQADGRVLSRDGLRQRSLAVAATLIRAGVRPEDGVGLHLPAGIDFVAGALGAMRAGCAYVPLDLDAPPARMRDAVADAGVTHVIAGAAGLGAALPGVTVIDAACLRPDGDGTTMPIADPARCAYRIFTSGSTGRPKAVEVEHCALANLILHYAAALGLARGTRWPMLASVVFDASVADVWPVLAQGGTVLVPPPGLLRDADGLISWLDAERASAAFVPAAVAERLLGRPWPRGIALRTLLTGGDALHRRPPPGLPFEVLNTYGPTENTVDSLWCTVSPGTGTPAIGQPILGVTAEILDEAGRPVAPDQVGELTLGGAQVARGYRGRPALSARVFEPDPRRPGGRRYRTGDRVSRDRFGECSFHGRLDSQVQLRGIRVEPGEVEAIVKADPRFAEAVCVPERLGTEVTGLAVFAVVAGGKTATAADLAALFAQHLPAAVRPRSILFVDRLPCTATGKLDRAGLAASRAVPAPSVLPGGDPVLRAWSRHVRPPSDVERDGVAGDFWSGGGDSLAVLNVLLDIEAETGCRVSLGSFIADPTLEGLRRLVAAKATPTMVELAPGRGPAIVCWYALAGDVGPYLNLLRGLAGHRVVALVSPGLGHPNRMPASVEAAASAGLAVLAENGIVRPTAMLGYSWAGLLAFEAARQLRARGGPQPYLGLIATMPPAGRLVALFRAASKAALIAAKFAKHAVTASSRRGVPFQWREPWTPLERQHCRIGERYRPKGRAPVQAEVFRERVVHGWESRLKRLLTLDDAGWGWWVTPRVRVTWLDGDHRAMITPEGAAVLAALILERLPHFETDPVEGEFRQPVEPHELRH